MGLIRQPGVMLLDEATSALDNESELYVQRSLDELMQSSKFTMIVIAHRLTTIRQVDKISVISAGCVVEEGNHEELVQLNQVYAGLIRSGYSGHSLDVPADSLSA